MTPEEKQKADAWVLLHSKDVVVDRIGKVIVEVFENTAAAAWIAKQLVDADKAALSPPLRMYFEAQLERNLRLILADGVGNEVRRLLQPMVDEAVARHAEQVDKSLKELKKLKSKGPIHGKR